MYFLLFLVTKMIHCFSFPYSLGTFKQVSSTGALMLYVFASKIWWPNKKSSRRNSPSTHLFIHGSVSYHYPLVIPKVFMLTQTNNCVKIRELVVFRQEAEMPLQSLSWVYLGGWECDHLACVALAT